MGYKAIDNELAIDFESAETIKTIFALRHQRKMSLRGIASYLNKIETATARGGKWHAGTVKYILDNPIYGGIVAYSGTRLEKASLAVI